MRKLGRVLVVMSCLVLLAGCQRSLSVSPSNQPLVRSPETVSSSAPTQETTPLPPATSPQQPTTCGKYAEQDALLDLDDYSTMTPEARVKFSEGTIRQIWQEEAAFMADGWPAAFLNGWRHDAWIKVDVQAPDEQTRLVILTHGDLSVTNKTRFEFRCVGKLWELSNIGPEWRWYTPSPSMLPNQDGELTEELARSLVNDVVASYGTTRMRVSATTPELERGRQKAILIFSGSDLAQTNFPGVSKHLKLLRQSADTVIGEWTSDAGASTGEKVLFQRTAGLWKVADHTERGQWALAPGTIKPRGFEFDLPLLGFALMDSRAQLRPLLPPDGGLSEFPAVVNVRKLSPAFDPLGKLYKVTTYSGGTSRGLNIGDPVSALYTLYGRPDRQEDGWLIYDGSGVSEEFRVRIAEFEGVERVAALVRQRTK